MTEPIKLTWPCGEDEFLLRMGELEAIDDATKDGALDFRYRISLGQERGSLSYAPVRQREVRDCIRLALIGAGMDRGKAEIKAKNAMIDGDAGELNLLCFTILSHSLAGKPHDLVGEDQAAESPND